MKKTIYFQLIIAILSCSITVHAQFELWGMTSEGGNTKGVIFKTDSIGNNYSVQYSFENLEQNPKGSLIKATNGKYYGMSDNGGNYGVGVIFEYDSSTDSVTILHHFDGTATGANPKGELIEASNGKFYGMTYAGGNNNTGVVFEYDPGTSTYTKLHDFMDHLDGTNPFGSLIQAADGKLYGMTYGGGSGTYEGILYELDINTGILTKLHAFGTTAGAHPMGHLLEATNGLLYGITRYGGTYGQGVIFSFNTSTSIYTKLQSFHGDSTGASPKGSPMQASNGKLYGMFNTGSGGSYVGGIFEYDIDNDTLIKKFDFGFTNSTGARPEQNNLVEGNPNVLYGMTNRGGANDDGVIFNYNITSGGYTNLHDFALDNSTNSNVYGSLLEYSPGKLLGMTNSGGNTGKGTLFEFDTTTSIHTVKHSFDEYGSGQNPNGSLTAASNGKFYALTLSGGAFNAGTLFEYEPFSGIYKKWHDFDGAATGANPYGSLIEASNGKLYGMTKWGGSIWGVLFEFNPGTGLLTKVHDFIHATGTRPCGSLIEASNGKLYGMTSYGGSSNNRGVLFEYDILSDTYTVKINFINSNGRAPEGSLIETSTGILYGLTTYGGTTDHGTVFEYDISGETLTTKYELSNIPDGQKPRGDLIKASNGKLYGMTSDGGVSGSGRGTIFKYDIPSGNLNVIHDFNVTTDGIFPFGSLLESMDGKLYGMTSSGGAVGSNDKGVLFEFDTVTGTFTKKLDFDGTNGSVPNYTQLIKILVHADWTGAVSNDWNNPSNWLQDAVPNIYTEVIIPDVSAASGNFPVVTSDTKVRNLYINPGAEVDVQSGVTLSVGSE